MEPQILNSDFINTHVLDVFDSFIWTDRYCGAGDFEFLTSDIIRTLHKLIGGQYLYLKESKHIMVIEDIELKSDPINGDKLKLSGRSLESILDRRIVWNQTSFKGDASFQDTIHQILTEQVGKLAGAIITGLIEGILAGGKAVVDAIIELAKKALGFFGIKIGANSPSTEFAKLGGYIPQGVAKGIERYTGTVIDATKTMAKEAISGFNDAISGISDSVDKDMSMSPTIRPVVDLTSVINGGKQIDKLLGQNLNVPVTAGRLSTMVSANGKETASQVNPVGQTIVFQQTNNSPKSLSAIEIYRQTRNQLSLLKGLAIK